MKISTILDHIDSGHMALPEFQRGYVWNRDQVRGLMDSLYRRHPVGSLLVWATESEGAEARGDGGLAPGVVKLLLDGQQRITSLYGIIRGQAPKFFDGNARSFTGLRFHLEDEEFSFYSPVKMKGDPLWIDVSELMQGGNDGLGGLIAKVSETHPMRVGDFVGRLTQVLGIREIDFHIDEVTGKDKTVEVVVDIFNRVNSGGTKLSKGDLALAKICADWPEARDSMKAALERWRASGYNFTLDWFLRSVNTIATGEARFQHLHELPATQIQDGVRLAERHIDKLLNLIGGRVGLDHDRVFFGRFTVPVMAHFLHRRGGKFRDAVERDRMLFWSLSASMWGRYSGSTETYIDQDLEAVEELEGGIDRLLEQLHLWHGNLAVRPGHFGGWSKGARFYPVLYLLTRMGEALDWGTGLPLKKDLLGKMSNLEVHHVFPKKLLYQQGFKRPEVNAVANFCFLTKETNLEISAKVPEVYLPEIEARHPGALASQWIPEDPELWTLERYPDFLAERRRLLAQATNRFLDDLLHEVEVPGFDPGSSFAESVPESLGDAPRATVPGGIDSEDEERVLEELNDWVEEQGLPRGASPFEVADAETGDPVALFDLAWPSGIQEGLSQPVAVLLNEGPETLAVANAHGYRYFTSRIGFERYISEEILPDLSAT